MDGDLQIFVASCLGLTIAIVVIGYFRLASALAKTDQVLEVWEKLVETPIVSAHVGRIFTYLLKIRNPYTQSISILRRRSAYSNFLRLQNHVVGSRTLSRNIESTSQIRWTVSKHSWCGRYSVCGDFGRSSSIHSIGVKGERHSRQNRNGVY